MGRLFLLLASCLSCHTAVAQYFQFSQFNLAPQRLNPATVASSNHAQANFIYRHQSTDGGVSLNTNVLNVSYPFINASGRVWSGVGFSFMHDKAGPSEIFSSQEVAASYAVTIPISKGHTLSFGFKGLYATRKISVEGFHTGLQFVPERGFDDGLSMGEDFNQYNKSLFTLSSGIFWNQLDKKGNQLANCGVSFFDFNTPNESRIGDHSAYPSTLVSSIAVRVYNKDKISLFPEVLFTHNAGNNKFNAGLVTRYELKTYRKKPSDHIELHTKYLSGKSAMVGLQLWREQFAIGLSYDFSLSNTNVANTGAFECGLVWRKQVLPATKRARQRNISKSSQSKKTTTIGKAQIPVSRDTVDTPGKTLTHGISLSERLKAKQDSISAIGKAGEMDHEALILEKTNLHFNFSFNSTELDNDAKDFLDEVVAALTDNIDLRIRLTGYTDNIGSQKFNLKLSKVRAESIRKYLMLKGVDADRIESTGKGMAEPLNDNSTEEARALNRRVEMKILYDF